VQRISHPLWTVFVLQRAGGDIQRDVDLQALAVQFGQLAQCLVQAQPEQVVQVGIAQQRQKDAGADDLAIGLISRASASTLTTLPLLRSTSGCKYMVRPPANKRSRRAMARFCWMAAAGLVLAARISSQRCCCPGQTAACWLIQTGWGRHRTG
jgi:hypothetical protein